MKEVKRPWGNFKRFALNEKCTVKILTVKPHQELSLQKHEKRKDKFYTLRYQNKAEEFDRFSKAFDHLVNSLKFKDK